MLTRGGKRYFITFIDDYSRFTYVFLIKTKDEAFEKFKEFKTMVENQKEKKLKFFEVIEVVNIFQIRFLCFVKRME